jgi:DNA polymerase
MSTVSGAIFPEERGSGGVVAIQFDLFDRTQNDIFSAPDYARFKELLATSNCKKCALERSRKNIVVDRGTPSSRIMVIGEAPGETEDSTGRAFVGKAGKLLDEIMKAIRLDTERDLLIANIVKCKPPANREPVKEEVSACLPYLRKQIELVQPRVILLLGAVALKHMIPGKTDFSMAEEAGTVFGSEEYPGVKFMVLYHPAYLLYDPRKKKDMWEHVKGLQTFLQESAIL